ncbi:hypothetical protein CF327_g7452 [Tilletia walkeri]|nr:hypothetical protein CF327_g7452 [Tilletia walkeri]
MASTTQPESADPPPVEPRFSLYDSSFVVDDDGDDDDERVDESDDGASSSSNESDHGEVPQLSVKVGMEAFESAIDIFNKLLDQTTVAGAFLKLALSRVEKLVETVEELEGNRGLYAKFTEVVLTIYQRFTEAAELAGRPIRPGTPASVVIEVVRGNVAAVRRKIEQFALLASADESVQRGEIQTLLESRIAQMERTLAALTVDTACALVLDAEVDSEQFAAATSKAEASDPVTTQESAGSIQELFKKSVRQIFQQITMALNFEVNGGSVLEDMTEGDQEQPSLEDRQLARTQEPFWTIRQESIRFEREDLQRFFSLEGPSNSADAVSDDDTDLTGVKRQNDLAESISELLDDLCTDADTFLDEGTLAGLRKLSANLEEFGLLQHVTPVLQILTVFSRRRERSAKARQIRPTWHGCYSA